MYEHVQMLHKSGGSGC